MTLSADKAQRERFEEWNDGESGEGYDLTRYPADETVLVGEYRDERVQAAWEAWQYRARFEAGRSAGHPEQLWELDLYQKAHIEMHAHNEQIGYTCCEFCEALERVHAVAGPIADKGDGK